MLTGKRVYLRLLEQEDIPKRTEWINDFETNIMFRFDWPISLSKSYQWFNKTMNDDSKMHFVIVDIKTNDLIGMVGLLNIDFKSKRAEVYLTIGNKDYRGKGLSTEVLQILINYSFNILALERLQAHNFTYNIASQKMFEKVGFLKEGIMRKHSLKNGKLEDINIYGLLKEEWR
ncbi:MAG: GNAT family N-acetyltransferase [Culicoidibacterales bacterium]